MLLQSFLCDKKKAKVLALWLQIYCFIKGIFKKLQERVTQAYLVSQCSQQSKLISSVEIPS